MALASPDHGGPRDVALTGSGRLRAGIDLDRVFHAAGVIEARAEHADLRAPSIGAAADLRATLAFEGADFSDESLVFRPSVVSATNVTVSREGRAHRGGSARVDLTTGRLVRGRPRDLTFVIHAKHPDLEWLSLRAPAGGGLGATARSAEIDAKLAIRRPDALFGEAPADAEVTGSMSLSARGEARLGNVAVGGTLAATGTLAGLDLERRTLDVRRLRVALRRVWLARGADRTVGWWGDFRFSRIGADFGADFRLATHVDARCRDAGPFLALLVDAGAVPSWASTLFPMRSLTASADLAWANDRADLDMIARSTSADVTARLRDLGGATRGAVRVETALVSVGVAFVRGESHVEVFAGEDWMRAQLEAASLRDDSSRAGSVAEP